jgi:hypothetical protein
MKQIIYILSGLVLLCFTHCKNGLFDAGDSVTKEFKITEPFRTIEIKQDFAIELINDTINKAIVTCGENLIDDMLITAQDDILTLDYDIQNNWSRSYEKIKLQLHLSSISWINVRKPCYIFTTDTFKTDNFIFIDWGKFTEMDICLEAYYIQIVMSSDNFRRFIVSGKTTYADIIQWGSAFVYADSLEIQNCSVDHRSVGDVHVNVTKELTVDLKSTGNVFCCSNPDSVIIKQQLSSGQLIFKK